MLEVHVGLTIFCLLTSGFWVFLWLKYRKLVKNYRRLFNHARANGLIVTEREMLEATMKAGGIGRVHADLMITSAHPEKEPDDAA